MRATGDNAQMIRALGVNVGNMIDPRAGAVQRAGRALRRAARAVPGLRRRADGHRHGGVGARQRHHRRGAGGHARSSACVITGAVMGSVLFRLLVAHRAARRPRPQRPEAGHRRVRVRRAGPARSAEPRRRMRPRQREAAGRRAAMPRACGHAGSRGVARRSTPGTPNEVRALRGRQPDDRRRLVRRSSSARTARASRRCSTRSPARSPLDAGHASRSTARDVTRWPEHRRAKLIGRVFQNPFSGTAPDMSIAENLALAARRGRRAASAGRSAPRVATSCAIACARWAWASRIASTIRSAASRAASGRR